MSFVRVRNLVKKFGSKVAVDNISFTVERGEIFGLIGPNGAGKTTTLRILATLLRPTSGVVEIDGIDVVSSPLKARKIISYLPEDSGAYPYMSGREYLEFVATVYLDDESKIKNAVRKGIRIAKLGSAIDDKIKTYSRGMKRRLQLARALMVSPKLAILDEPTSGVDVVHSIVMRKAIKEEAERGLTVILSSHNMLEVEFLCDRVAFIHEGRILAVGSPEELKSRFKASNLEEAFFKVVSPA